MLLWQTGDLSSVYPSFSPMTAGIDSCILKMDKQRKMDGSVILTASHNIIFKFDAATN